MSETQLQFRVGMLVIAAMVIAVVLTFQFGGLSRYFEPRYALAVHFDEAPGLVKGTPVRMNGLTIGGVSEVRMDERRGGVLALLEIDERRRLRNDSSAQLVRSILGDASIEFSAGSSPEFLSPGDLVAGIPPSDPLEIVRRVETQVGTALASFSSTSQEWEKVARNLNRLVETKEGHLDDVIEKTATSLATLTQTLQTAQQTFNKANDLIADPKMMASIRQTLESVPLLVNETRLGVNETRQAIADARIAIDILKQGLVNVEQATHPFVEGTPRMVNKAELSLDQLHAAVETLQEILKDADKVSTMLAEEKGTLHQLATDPQLYLNLNNSTAAMSILMQKLDYILADVRVFTDKVARHPELLGVGGAIRGSSGLKDPQDGEPANVREAGYQQQPGLPRYKP